MKTAVLSSLLLIATMSVSGVASAGLAQQLQKPTHEPKKDFTEANKVKEVKKSRSVKALESTLNDWVDAFNNKDIELLMSYYAENTLYASPDSGLIRGIDEVKAWYQAYFPQMNGTLKYVQESITAKGSMGSIVLKFYIEPNDGSNVEAAFKGRALLVFQKQTFGKWFLLYDMDHSAPDVQVKDFQ